MTSKRGEIELTTALEQVREKHSLNGIKLNGKMFELGVPDELRNTIYHFQNK